MSNYVRHKVICRKQVLEQYFLDPDPFGDGTLWQNPYITFNRLFGAKSLNKYSEKYGVDISYEYGFSWEINSDGLCEVKFCTKWEYPIRAIIRMLELAHDTIWYVVEENHIYVSKFYWLEGVKEDVLFVGDGFEQWISENKEFDYSLEEPDDGVWYYLSTATGTWRNWESTDGFARYLDVAVVDVELPPFLK